MGRGDTSEPVRGDAGILEARSGVAGTAAAGEAGRKIEGGTARRFLTGLALASVRGYQIFLGPFFGGSCKFHPSCSRYTYEAIQRFGARRGAWLGLKRFLRCRPFSAGGYDPVPTAWPYDDLGKETHFAEFKDSNRFLAAAAPRNDNAISFHLPAKTQTQTTNRRDRAEAAN